MRELASDEAGSSQQIPAVVWMRVAPQFDVLVLFSTWQWERLGNP